MRFIKLILVSCFFLLISIKLPAQISKVKVKKEVPESKTSKKKYWSLASLDLYYGYLVYKDTFNHQLNSGKNLNFNAPPRIIGLGISGYERLIGPSYVLAEINFEKYLPNQISINDSIHANFSGFNFGLGLGKRFATKSNNLSIAGYLGFNTGRTVLKNNDNISAQNPFFCPKAIIQPKLIIKRVAISISLIAQRDFTNSKWLKTLREGKNNHIISGLNQTAITGLLSVGYRLY